MTAPAPDRRCGTCVLWERDPSPANRLFGSVYGDCTSTQTSLPACVQMEQRKMKEYEGTRCSQWSDGAEALGETDGE